MFVILASLVFLHLAGAVCLLLWGTRMVKNGVTRAYGTSLRRFIQYGTKNRMVACASGVGITALLQSSTATVLLLISFVKKHPIPLALALSVIIWADIATTLVAQVLIFDFSWVSPAFLVVGIIGYMRYEHAGRMRHIFRSVIGLGLILLSLSLIKQASVPLISSEILPLILAPLYHDPVMAVLFAALLTWVIHSSLASILLFAAFASHGIIDMPLGLLLVLGVNLGGAFIAFVATYRDGVVARRMTVGNIIMRCFIVFLFYAGFDVLLEFSRESGFDPAHQIINLHMAFNVVLGLVFLPLVTGVSRLCHWIVPSPKDVPLPVHEPLYLDDKALGTPVIALAGAARETLRMAEMVEEMLSLTIESFKQNNDGLAAAIIKQDNDVDRLYSAIKLYLIRLTQESLDPKEGDRYLQIITFATNLEHIGDLIDKSLMDLAKKKVEKRERFSDEGWAEIKSFHLQVLDNMKLVQTIFLSEDPILAQRLIDNKKIIRNAERETSDLHFERLREGLPATIATSALHLDIIRDYRRINSYITSVAYAILENAQKYEKQRRS